MPFSQRFKTILVHLSLWFCFAGYEISISYMMGVRAPLFDFLCFYLLNIGLFYFNAYTAAPAAASYHYPLLSFPVIFCLELASYELLSIGMDVFVQSVQNGHWVMDIRRLDFIRVLWRGVYFIELSMAYYLGLRSINNFKLKMAAENAHLRAQINPHLLFNTLNYIFTLTEDVSAEASESILLLADSMRYAMMPQQSDGMADLHKEIEQIERLIKLYQIRFKGKLLITTEISPSCRQPGNRIPPLLLLTFIENMFKHGNLYDAPALIRISVADGMLYFHTVNLQANRRTTHSDNIGLANARSRLKIFYRKNFVLETHAEGSNFIVNLKIKL